MISVVDLLGTAAWNMVLFAFQVGAGDAASNRLYEYEYDVVRRWRWRSCC